eukprot:TRINITY_DN108757_c0_g1_i1.p1 TRINITY_DN108757_c0_g1~~TRINITY_DN108757_c0_g1_i1.p1  ORF type:complete len:446 (+),score=91.01 TRINITY_DN108757_c0_g1_i1:72-1409(+)
MGSGSSDLRGTPPELINSAAVHLAFGIGGATLLGWLLGRCCSCKSDRPDCWIVALLVTSYATLLPGLQMTLLSYNISVSALGSIYMLQDKMETTFEFVSLLASSGSLVGAICVVVYAMIIPAAKLVLLLAGEILRYSSDAKQVQWARWCIGFVQIISKWATPDMFAYILLEGLVRGMNKPPTLLSKARLDIGFACFSFFCVGSTVSSLGIRMPQQPLEEDDERDERAQCSPMSQGQGATFQLVLGLCVAFAVFVLLGLLTPCMSLRLDLDLIAIPPSFKPFVETLHLPDLARADVSVVGCMVQLWGSLREGELNSGIALVMFAVFVILFSVLDMILLFLAALKLRAGEGGSGQLLSAAYVLKKLSMLDVMCVGVVVVTLCMSVYGAQGVVLNMREGLVALLLAEAAHYAAYSLVNAAAAESSLEQADTLPLKGESTELERLAEGL